MNQRKKKKAAYSYMDKSLLEHDELTLSSSSINTNENISSSSDNIVLNDNIVRLNNRFLMLIIKLYTFK